MSGRIAAGEPARPSTAVTHWLPHLFSIARRSLALRLTALYGVIFVLGLASLALFVGWRVNHVVHTTIQAYGSTVSGQMAHVALDAVMQRDPIALQAHLNRLLKTPGIVSAAVYDVENQLLAQGGATPREQQGRPYLHHFPSTLAMGDTALGTVVVTVDGAAMEQLLAEVGWVLGGGGLLAVLLMLGLSLRLASEWEAAREAFSQSVLAGVPDDVLAAAWPPGQRPARLVPADVGAVMTALQAHLQQLKTPSQAALLSAASEITNPQHGFACVVVECANLEMLQRQVSRERLRALLQQFQSRIDKTARLYSGQRSPMAGPGVRLLFPASKAQPSLAALHAVRCAYVLAGVLQECRDEQLGIALQWHMAVDWVEPCDNDILRNLALALHEQRCGWLCRQVGSEQLALSLEVAAHLREETALTLQEHSGDGGHRFCRLASFAEGQQTLLDRQVGQLREL